MNISSFLYVCFVSFVIGLCCMYYYEDKLIKGLIGFVCSFIGLLLLYVFSMNLLPLILVDCSLILLVGVGYFFYDFYLFKKYDFYYIIWSIALCVVFVVLCGVFIYFVNLMSCL